MENERLRIGNSTETPHYKVLLVEDDSIPQAIQATFDGISLDIGFPDLKDSWGVLLQIRARERGAQRLLPLIRRTATVGRFCRIV